MSRIQYIGLSIFALVVMGVAAAVFTVRWWPIFGPWALLWGPVGVILTVAVAIGIIQGLLALLAWAERKWWK